MARFYTPLTHTAPIGCQGIVIGPGKASPISEINLGLHVHCRTITIVSFFELFLIVVKNTCLEEISPCQVSSIPDPLSSFEDTERFRLSLDLYTDPLFQKFTLSHPLGL